MSSARPRPYASFLAMKIKWEDEITQLSNTSQQVDLATVFFCFVIKVFCSATVMTRGGGGGGGGGAGSFQIRPSSFSADR